MEAPKEAANISADSELYFPLFGSILLPCFNPRNDLLLEIPKRDIEMHWTIWSAYCESCQLTSKRSMSLYNPLLIGRNTVFININRSRESAASAITSGELSWLEQLETIQVPLQLWELLLGKNLHIFTPAMGSHPGNSEGCCRRNFRVIWR